jgi:hypothetical protein
LAEFSIKPLRMRIHFSCQVVDPDSRIHDCHASA